MDHQYYVEQAANYAAKLIKQNNLAVGLCMYKAAKYYNLDITEVARECGKRGYAIKRKRAIDSRQLDLFEKNK